MFTPPPPPPPLRVPYNQYLTLVIWYCGHTHIHPQNRSVPPPPSPRLVIRYCGHTHTRPQNRSVPPPPGWLSGIVITHTQPQYRSVPPPPRVGYKVLWSHIPSLNIDQYLPPPTPGLVIRYCDHTYPPSIYISTPPPGLVIRYCDHTYPPSI